MFPFQKTADTLELNRKGQILEKKKSRRENIRFASSFERWKLSKVEVVGKIMKER